MLQTLFRRAQRHDIWGQETAGMAEWYARDAQLDEKLAGVVEAIDEHLTGTKVSNSAK
jgi:hypothetical protein